METTEILHEEIRTALHAAQSVLIASHIRPDGDAIGSVLGLGLALQEAGKKVQLVLVDGLPTSFRHLSGSQLFHKAAVDEVDLRISVDSSDLERLGGALQGLPPDINIDHHVTNLNFGRLNYVDATAVATCAILARCLPAWGFNISKPVAEALLTGILTDTIGFRTSNMTPEALRVSAALMEHGANLPEIYARTLIYRSFKEARYWGSALSRLSRDDSLIWTSLSLEDRKAIGYNGNDDADLNTMLSSIHDANISVLFIEQKDEHVKVSWRSRPGIDVSRIALSFGGGGHPAASGADIPGTLEDVQDRVLSATRELLITHLKINSGNR